MPPPVGGDVWVVLGRLGGPIVENDGAVITTTGSSVDREANRVPSVPISAVRNRRDKLGKVDLVGGHLPSRAQPGCLCHSRFRQPQPLAGQSAELWIGLREQIRQ